MPASDLEGEQASPTQPLPVAPPAFARQRLTEADLTERTPDAHAAVLKTFRASRSNGQFVPPSTQGTVIFPGFDGGAEWGGQAFDAATGRFFVNANEMAWILTMVPLQKGGGPGQRLYQVNCAVCHGAERKGVPAQMVPPLVGIEKEFTRSAAGDLILHGKGVMPSFGGLSPSDRAAIVGFLFGDVVPSASDDETPDPTVKYSHTGYNRFLDPDGYPAVRPPWGTLNAIDLNTGTIAWSVPLGELPELTAKGTPPTGTENYGGPAITASGLLFVAATKDEKFRAFDTDTGKALWQTSLPAGGYATPAVYSVNGKQFVVIAAGGGKMGTKSGDAYVAFALP